MYKRCITVSIMLLMSIQMLGCKYTDGNESVETGAQMRPREIKESNMLLEEGEELRTYTLLLGDIFDTQIRNLSGKIYFYEDKLYIDAGETYIRPVLDKQENEYVRLIFGKRGDEIVLLDTLELPSTWDRRTVGTNHYLVSGDKSQQVLYIYDLNTGDMETIKVGENQTISCWDVESGKVYYNVESQGTNIINEIVIRDLDEKKDWVITLDVQFDRIHQMSVNNKEEIGIFYWNVDSDEDHLGIVRDGKFIEIDTSNVEIWNLGRNELHEFQLLEDKFMMCTEDIGHTLTPWNRSYEIFFDGSWQDIPCEREDNEDKNVLGYVDEFYYVNDYYLVYRSPWTMSGGFGADVLQNAKVWLYTMNGKYYKEIDIPKSNLLQTSVYFMCSDETIYVISISGEEHKVCVQEIPLQ